MAGLTSAFAGLRNQVVVSQPLPTITGRGALDEERDAELLKSHRAVRTLANLDRLAQAIQIGPASIVRSSRACFAPQ